MKPEQKFLQFLPNLLSSTSSANTPFGWKRALGERKRKNQPVKGNVGEVRTGKAPNYLTSIGGADCVSMTEGASETNMGQEVELSV